VKVRILILLIAVLVGSTSCASYERLEDVERSVDKFHDQLNQQQYREIYVGADPELHNRITEAEFTSQLVNARNQLGTVTSKAHVGTRDSFWRKVNRIFNGGREQFTHGNRAEGDQLFAAEVFVWAVGAGEPRLVSFELSGATCRKPCSMGFGYDLP